MRCFPTVFLLTGLLTASALGVLPQDSTPPDHPRELRKPPARPLAPPRLERFEFERGTRLIVLEDDRDDLIDGRLIFRGGSLEEDPDHTGLAELAADVLIAGGTTETSGVELEQWLDRRAASIVAWSDHDSFRIDFSCFEQDLDPMLEMLGELLAVPAYPEAEVERGKRRLRERLDRHRRDARDLADQALTQAIYGADSPRTRSPRRRTVEQLTREDLVKFHGATVGADRLLVGMVGELRSRQLLARLDVILGPLASLGPPKETPGADFLRPSRTRIYLYDRPGATSAEIRVAGPGTRRIHQDSCALELWSEAVGSKGGLGFRPEWERAGILLGSRRVPSDRVGRALEELLALLRGGLRELSPQELATVRERVLSAEVFRLDRPEEVLARALELEFHGYPANYREQRLDQLSTLGAEEISEAVRRHLDLDRLVIVVVGPAKEIERQLSPFGELTRIDPAVEGATLIDKILAGLGGRQAWAGLRFLESEIEYSVGPLGGIKLHVWQDLTAPRMRVEQEFGGSKSTTVLNERGAWTRSGDSVVELPPSQHRALVAAGWRDVHRLLRLLAVSEETDVESEDAHRFQVVDGPAKDTWIELDEAGHPSRIGYPGSDGEVVLEFSGWSDFDGIYAPTEIEKLGGWTKRLESLILHEELDAELFERP